MPIVAARASTIEWFTKVFTKISNGGPLTISDGRISAALVVEEGGGQLIRIKMNI